MDPIGTSIAEMLATLSLKAPVLMPAIFTTQMKLCSLLDLASNKSQSESIKTWITAKCPAGPEMSFVTSVNCQTRQIVVTNVRVSYK